MTTKAPLSEWLRLAYRGEAGCPPPEAYLADELAALDADARARLESHAESCAACAAELDLAQAFESAEPAGAQDHRAVERIVRRLERRPPHGRRGGWLGRPDWGSILRTPAFQLAAAAVLVIGIGIGIRDAATPPPLTGGSGSGVVRSSTLELRAPLGDIDGAPVQLAWEPVEGAASYRVTVRSVDDTVLWSAETAASTVNVDARLEALLRQAVSYGWGVEALGADGARIAWSADASFRIRPSER